MRNRLGPWIGVVVALVVLSACTTTATPVASSASFELSRVVLPPGSSDLDTVEQMALLAGRQSGIPWESEDPSGQSFDLVLTVLDSAATLEIWSQSQDPLLVDRVTYAFTDKAVFSSDDSLLFVLRKTFQRLRQKLDSLD